MGSLPRRLGLIDGVAHYVTVSAERPGEAGQELWLQLANPFLFGADEAWLLGRREDGTQLLVPGCAGDPGKPAVDLTQWQEPLQRREPPLRGPPPVRRREGCLPFRGLFCGGGEFSVAWVGAERNPVLQLEEVARFPRLLRRHGLGAQWRGWDLDVDGFPGAKALLPSYYAAEVRRCVAGLARQIFRVELAPMERHGRCPNAPPPPSPPPPLLVASGFMALTNTNASEAARLFVRMGEHERQTLSLMSHHDTPDEMAAGFRGLASVHALYDPEIWGAGLPGTGLFRDRATGTERYSPGREAAYHRTALEIRAHLRSEMSAGRRTGRPLVGGSEYEELVHHSRLRFNRMVVYPQSLYHSNLAPPEVLARLSRDPRLGRLTANLFFTERMAFTSQRDLDDYLDTGRVHCEGGTCTQGSHTSPSPLSIKW